MLAGFFLTACGPPRSAAGEVATTLREPDPESAFVAAAGAVRPPPEDCFLGVVTAAEAVDVAAQVEGLLDRVLAGVGDPIESGQVVAVIDPSGLRDRLAVAVASLATATAERRQARLEAERAQRQHERSQALGDLLSGEEVEAAGFAHRVAEIRVAAADARAQEAQARIKGLQGDLARTEIRAPFDGRVAARYRDAGAVVSRGTPILRVLGSRDHLTRFAVAPERAAAIAPGMPIRVEIEAPRVTFEASVDTVAPEIDSAAQMVFVEAALPVRSAAEGPLLSGAVARISLRLSGPSCLAERGESQAAPSGESQPSAVEAVSPSPPRWKR